MKILTASQMRDTDRRTVAEGIPDEVLMENAGKRVVEFLKKRFAPLWEQRIVVFVGRGKNGGDGVVVARELYRRFHPRQLDVVLVNEPPENFSSLGDCGIRIHSSIQPEMRAATLVIDALLGTGLTGPPREPVAALISQINGGFPEARIIAVDIPSGLASDEMESAWPHVKAHHTVTFTAPKPAQIFQPAASSCGELIIEQIGTRPELCESDLSLIGPDVFRHLFARRKPTAHKGDFGHVLVVGGAPGKSGAADMAGIASLRAGAGLVTVCSSAPPRYPELMWQALEGLDTDGKTVVAVGPGLGISSLPAIIIDECTQPLVIDADGLNSIAGQQLPLNRNVILTPHPGEMARLTGKSVAEVQQDRIGCARTFASGNGVTLVLKGRNTLVAFPDGQVAVNATGNPGMATGGSGDILTGLVAGLLAQFPNDTRAVVQAAVWLHGRAGDLGVAELGEKCLIATDLLRFLPKAMEECAPI